MTRWTGIKGGDEAEAQVIHELPVMVGEKATVCRGEQTGLQRGQDTCAELCESHADE